MKRDFALTAFSLMFLLWFVINPAPDPAQALLSRELLSRGLLSRGMIHRDLGGTIAAIQDIQQAAGCFCHQGMMLAYQKTPELLDQICVVGMAVG